MGLGWKIECKALTYIRKILSMHARALHVRAKYEFSIFRIIRNPGGLQP